MPGATLFTSEVLTLEAATTLLFVIFDTDANDRGPVAVRLFNTETGAAVNIIDPLFPPTIRFIHASQDLGAADIYIDDPLTTPLIEDQDFLGISAELEVPVGLLPITYTAFDNIGTILVDEDISMAAGARLDYYIAGDGASPFSITMLPNRRSVETLARLTVVYTETNHDPMDFYIVVADTDIADVLPRYIGMSAGNQSSPAQLIAGSFDLYLAVGGEKTVVTGPVRLDIAVGDVVTAIVYDTVETATADIVLFRDF
ncbi:MAG: DUF4397 domain-containing protein [Desulfobulbaceae bacterium]|nr:DUF4397 domain-containing protein [Desulfobulbaceae bacterium]